MAALARSTIAVSQEDWLMELLIGRHLHPPPPPLLIPHEPNPKEEIEIDPATEACYQAKPLERVRIFPDCVEWIKPPPVLSVVASQGEWTKWEEMTDGSFICRGKGWQAEDVDAVIFYDRENRRELVMNANKRPPKGVVSDMKAFGMPTPVACYWNSNQWTLRAVNSRWIYRHCHPVQKEWAGMIALTPKEDKLPLDLELAAQALLNELQPMDVDEEDRISLGSDNGNLENEVVSTATKEAEAMDVESLPLALKDATEPVSKASSDTRRGEQRMAAIQGAPSCHLYQEAPSTPRTNEEILRAIRTASEKDLVVFILHVIVSADGLIWVSTTTSEGAQSFLNSAHLEDCGTTP
ncbi:hypothetical protein DXG01_007850 [Tephrocybe rancida]|nr:hypothetical protein DXG01_007850 [Tephrocybe rancida]